MFEDRRKIIGVSLLYLSWVAVGIYAGPLVWPWVLGSAVLLWRKEMLTELFVGFWFVLILSDSLEDGVMWAKSLKNVYILFLAFVLIVDRELFRPMNRIWYLFLPFFAIAVISLVSSPEILQGAQRTLSYILIFVIAPNFALRLYRERGGAFFRDMVRFGVIIIAIGYLYKYIDLNLAISHGGRLRGLFGNPNGLGLFLIVVFVFFYTTDALFKGQFSRLEKWVIYGVIGLCVVSSASRNAMISIGLFLLFVRFFRISFGFGLVGMIVGLGAYMLISQNLLEIISYLGLEEYLRVETLEEGSGRLIAWQFAWENIQDSMLIGKGFMYDLILMRENFDWLSRAGHEGGVHNSYLILWLNTGLIGIIFYFRAFFLLFLRAAKLNKVAIPAMVAVMFSIFFEPWLAASLNPYTIVFLVVLTMISTPEINGVRIGEDGELIREEIEDEEELDSAAGDIKLAEA